jgi:hypothetical protein
VEVVTDQRVRLDNPRVDVVGFDLARRYEWLMNVLSAASFAQLNPTMNISDMDILCVHIMRPDDRCADDIAIDVV